MYALADCNNFFVSCERVFNPSLNGKPVVVLSNNDGCIIARSNEAKGLGIPMGCPAFRVGKYTEPKNVIMLSARHRVYHDLSCRIMAILGREVERLEVYSVDEAFFTLPFADDRDNHELLAKLVKRIYKYVGVPVSIGFAPTRTLAKLAAHRAKKDPSNLDRVKGLTDRDEIDSLLAETPIDDVWGIGRRLSEALRSRNIYTAAQFAALPTSLVRAFFTVTGARTQLELRGEDCQIANPVTIAHKSIMNSRTFGKVITKRHEIADAVLSFAQHCAKQLRDEGTAAKSVTTYIRGDYYREDLPFYSNSCRVALPIATNDAATIISHALIALNNIYRDGFGYRKAGVLVTDITPETAVQMNLFHDNAAVAKRKKLMRAIDDINNNFGKSAVKLVPEVGQGLWKPNQNHFAETGKNLRFYTAMSPVSLD